MLIKRSRTPQYVLYVYAIESFSYSHINYYVMPENHSLTC